MFILFASIVRPQGHRRAQLSWQIWAANLKMTTRRPPLAPLCVCVEVVVSVDTEHILSKTGKRRVKQCLWNVEKLNPDGQLATVASLGSALTGRFLT